MQELLRKLYLGSGEELLIELSSLNSGEVRSVGFLNAHAINLAFSDPEFCKSLLDCDYLLRDGVGVEAAMLLHRMPAGENLNGTDFIPRLLARSSGRSVALLGSVNEILASASRRLESEFGVVVSGAMDGFSFNDSEYVEAARSLSPNIILIAMGMPKQEKLMRLVRQHVASSRGTVVLSGGAVLSFLTGRERRAPKVVQVLRLEWLWRFAHDPKRLFNRYFIGGAKFTWLVVASVASRKDSHLSSNAIQGQSK